MSEHTWNSTRPERLARLLEISNQNGCLWEPGELAAMFRTQLDLPVTDVLAALSRRAADQVRAAGGAKPAVRTLADLLFSPDPPLELLEITKQSAKAHHNSPDAGMPAEIALMLYYASIAVALSKLGQRLSKLDDTQVLEGFTWAGEQKWIDDRTRQLFTDAIAALKA